MWRPIILSLDWAKRFWASTLLPLAVGIWSKRYDYKSRLKLPLIILTPNLLKYIWCPWSKVYKQIKWDHLPTLFSSLKQSRKSCFHKQKSKANLLWKISKIPVRKLYCRKRLVAINPGWTEFAVTSTLFSWLNNISSKCCGNLPLS